MQRIKLIQKLLDKSWNKTNIAKELGISRQWLYYLIKKHNLKESEFVIIKRKK